jgi:hypothetical protein
MTGSTEIADVLRTLPIKPDREREVHNLSLRLALASMSGAYREQPNVRLGGASRAKNDLSRFGELCYELGKHIQRMRLESHEVLKVRLNDAIHPDALFVELSRSIEAARCAYYSLPDDDESAPRGRPEKHHAKEVTKHAAEAYESLTAKPATYTTDWETSEIGGEFVHFLSRLFEVLHINASAKTQAKNFARAKNTAR